MNWVEKAPNSTCCGNESGSEDPWIGMRHLEVPLMITHRLEELKKLEDVEARPETWKMRKSGWTWTYPVSG